LFKNIDKKQQLHIHTSVISKNILPEYVKLSEKKEYQSYYKSPPNYIYAHTTEFRIFGEVIAPCHLLSRVLNFVYPGGAGRWLEYYKFLEGPKSEERRQTPEMPSS
jgi:hypothetical protein